MSRWHIFAGKSAFFQSIELSKYYVALSILRTTYTAASMKEFKSNCEVTSQWLGGVNGRRELFGIKCINISRGTSICTHSRAWIPFKQDETTSRTFSQVIFIPAGPVSLNVAWSSYQYSGKATCKSCLEKDTRSSSVRGFRGALDDEDREKNSSSPIVNMEWV